MDIIQEADELEAVVLDELEEEDDDDALEEEEEEDDEELEEGEEETWESDWDTNVRIVSMIFSTEKSKAEELSTLVFACITIFNLQVFLILEWY